MNKNNASGGFDFTFDPSLDPLGGSWDFNESEEDPGPFLPNVEGRTEFLPPDADRVPVIEKAMKQDEPDYALRPAEERIAELFEYMNPHRGVLLDIVRASEEPCSVERMENELDSAPSRKFSVYTVSNLCVMLEAAGALERVTEDGTAWEHVELQPDIAVIDGEEYYVPTQPPTVCWRATDEGTAFAAHDDPEKRLDRLFEKESDLLAIHKQVLSLAAGGDGITVAQLSTALDSHPLIAQPRRFFVQHFVEGLERAGAIVWANGAWHTTDSGKAALETLADVPDDFEPPETEAADATGKHPTVATETDGIRW